jgi:protocatechuate 3,4-dioxygenase beta subunit
MNTKHAFRRAALTLAGASLLAPHAAALAAGSVSSTTTPTIQTASILDVSLSQRGSLTGQVVDAQGAPVVRAAVSVQAAGREVAATTTNDRGEFAVNNLRGGNYTITAGDSTGVYRVWTASAAPPAAKQGVLMVSGRQIARAQGVAGFGSRTGLIVLGTAAGIVTAGVVANNNDSSS